VRTVAPARVYPIIEGSQTMGMSLLGLCAFGAAFVVVSRRRPLQEHLITSRTDRVVRAPTSVVRGPCPCGRRDGRSPRLATRE